MSTSSNFLNCSESAPLHEGIPKGLVTDDTRSTLVQAVKACLVAIDKPNSVRTGLRQINCELRGSELFLTATNGHICLTVEVTIPHIDPCSFAIDGDSAKAFVSNKGYGRLVPAFDAFPDTRQVIPTSFAPSEVDGDGNTPRVGFSGLYLNAIGKILTALKLNRGGVESAVAMRHNGPCSPVLFETDFAPESTGSASIRGFALVVMPVRLN